jgi:hypothetical protein
MGVILGLQVDQGLRAEPDRFVEHCDIEVRHPDMAREALPLGPGEGGHRLAERDLRVRPVHEQKIDEVDAEVLQALVDGVCEVIGAQKFVRYLSGQKDLAARHAGSAHAFSDAALGAVFPSRVDVPIAELERGGDDLAAIAQRRGAEADGGDFGAVRG